MHMSFTWPLALLSGLVVPFLVGLYFWQKRRKRRVAVRFSSVALIRAAAPSRSRWRRLLPMVLFLLGLGLLGIASARPQASVTVPIGRTTIILALDVSRSMCATDIAPNRLTVAQEAARTFIKDQSKGTRIGIVEFAGFAEVVVAPTTDKEALIAAIDGFTTARGTAIGAATLKAIDAIAAVNPSVAPVGPSDPTDPADQAASTDPAVPTDKSGADKATKNDYVPDIIVVLTDGANTQGIDPIEAAQQAVERKVRVYTIGFGTTNPTQMSCSASQLGGEALGGRFPGTGGGFGGGGGGGGFGPGGRQGRFLTIDEPTLREVAAMTGGAYYGAKDASQLKKVFAELPKQVELQSRQVEISAGFAALGALLALVAMVLSLFWNRN